MAAVPKPGTSLHRRHRRAGAVRGVVGEFSGMLAEDRLDRAVHDERVRLSRELHDGALQSLAGAALQLEALAAGVGNEFQGIRKRLRDIQGIILEEERELRTWIESLREGASTMLPAAEPGAHIKRICRRIQRQYGLPVRYSVTGGRLPGPAEMRDQIYRLVQEGLINIVKHSHASAAQVDRSIANGHLRLVLRDNGRGFPFHGRFNLQTLNAMRCGPVSIKERVATMDGDLVLTSTASGSCLEIELPLRLRSLSCATRPMRRTQA
jgi:signal transduction histidine kinase